ncbi:MAG: hypothetical protein RIS41_565 [Actinomycetota bacterium]
MHLSIVTTSPVIAEVLAEELREVRGVSAEVVDIVSVENGDFLPEVDDVVLVTEAAIDRWCCWRMQSSSSVTSTVVIGALGSRWLMHESPENRGFVGCIDFKWPARDLVRELDVMRCRSAVKSEPAASCSSGDDRGAMCHDDIDRRIAAYITMGMSDRDIGAKVFLSSQTVRNRVSRMLVRTQLTNRTQLAMACMVNPEIMRVQRTEDVSTPCRESIAR